ncbi:MAG: hypothetical protein ACXIU7_09755 [Roseinatronobacter sp.]
MKMQRILAFGSVLGLVLSGCGPLRDLRGGSQPTGSPEAVTAQTPQADTVRPQARPASGAPAAALGRAGLTPAALDRTTEAERAAALAPPAGRTQFLGETLASLGSPSEPGLWLRTGLVNTTTRGRVELADGSGSMRVELRPSGAGPGAGSQMSLAAFTTLALPLTQLVALRVFVE